MALRVKVPIGRATFQILAGITIWYLVVTTIIIFRYNNVFYANSVPYFRPWTTTNNIISRRSNWTDQNLALVGVITANQFLTTRIIAANKTWVKDFPGKVIFFTSENVSDLHPPGIEVVALPSVTDEHPPQKKAFLMLKYMHDHYINNFRFFIRIEDDTYIKAEELVRYLHSVESRGTSVIGSTVFDIYGGLKNFGLQHDENYCMGGPGVIIPQEILRKTGPRIRHCLKNLASTQEDVELGRCFRTIANASCTWAAENLFYHDYQDEKVGFNHSLNNREIHNALTLHPVKEPSLVYRLHQYLLTLKTEKLYRSLQRLRRSAEEMQKFIGIGDNSSKYLSQERPEGFDDKTPWDFTVGSLFTSYTINPKTKMPADRIIGMNTTVGQLWNMIPTLDQIDSKKIRVNMLLFLHSRKNKLRGKEYFVTVTKKYRDSPESDEVTLNRNVYAIRPFHEAELIEDERIPDSLIIENDRGGRTFDDIRVNVVVSLVGRFKIFLTFMKNFEDQFLKTSRNVSLSIILFRNEANDTSDDVIAYIDRLQKIYSGVPLNVTLSEGDFSRGRALQMAAESFGDDDLLLLADIDLKLDASVLLRVILNTKPGRSVYSPIVFSQDNPNSLPKMFRTKFDTDKKSTSRFHSKFGQWRQFAYGILACYKSDLFRVGGFNLDIKGWGLEDVDLMDKFIMDGITIFRSVDVGIFHNYHPIDCSKKASEENYKMCIGSMVNTIASTEIMSAFIYRTNEILNLNPD